MVQKTPSLKGKTVAITRPAGQAEEAGKLIDGERRHTLLYPSHRNQRLKQL